ncbi:hypothetical protein ACH5RR_030008 [Cinchona calisaya]|uniref:Reverse transcriptase domain-containing protein n=1 Tax=Cinchona calisaya TaxID=153742 RepID=A0ABD2YWM3_9GENT
MKLWKPILFGRGGPTVSHCIFADDVTLFSSCDSDYIRAVSEVLLNFSLRSGLNINAQKSHIFFSPDTTEERKLQISELLNIPRTEDLGKYLGFPIGFKGIFFGAQWGIEGKFTRLIGTLLAKRVRWTRS